LRKRPKKCRASSSTSAHFSGWLLCFFVHLFLPRCILVSYYFIASLDGQSDQHHLHRITSTKSSHPPPTMFGWLLHIANKQPPLDAPYHTLGGRVPSSIRVDNHLTEGDVVSPRSTATQMGEESIISQYSINSCNPIVAMPFGGIIFPLERVHDCKGGWRQLVNKGALGLSVVSAAAVEGKRHRWGGWSMGSGGCIRGRRTTSPGDRWRRGRASRPGEAVTTEIFCDFWTRGM
jgi:hypothetical protein